MMPPELLSTEMIQKRASNLENWIIKDDHHLESHFKFPDFASAMSFAVQVGNIAEKINHHPEITIAPGMVKLTIYTHDRGGLTDWDFDFAEKVNDLKKK